MHAYTVDRYMSKVAKRSLLRISIVRKPKKGQQ